MPSISQSITIDRPRAEVFAWMQDPANQPMFQSNLIAYERLDDGPIDKGSRVRGETRVAGRTIEWTSEFTEYDEPNMAAFRSIEAPMEFEGTYTYEDAGEGTKVTYDFQVSGIGGFFGKLTDPIVTKMYERDVRSNLENLKEILET
jgi:uncharacterized membrane protein